MKSRYNSIEGRLQHFQKIIVMKELSEIRAIINDPPIRKKLTDASYIWKDVDEVENFIEKFSHTFDKLADYIKLFNES